MPRMDGLEATRRLKGNPDTASVPVVIVSAFTTRQDRERALQAGASEFVPKPCDPEALAMHLRKYS
jgi:CheY-like chemotaxis protein